MPDRMLKFFARRRSREERTRNRTLPASWQPLSRARECARRRRQLSEMTKPLAAVRAVGIPE